MSDDEFSDDYMSDVLLSSLSDVRPGINANNRAQKRFLLIEANRRAAEERVEARKPQKKAELERNMLEEGLSRPIDSASKGFSLLAKMGYKPGMSLGRKREGEEEGIKVPLAIPIKVAKTGLGHETQELEMQKDRCDRHMAEMKRLARDEISITEAFRVRKRFAALHKRLIADLQKARKVCEELDLRKNRDGPDEFWFWPIYRSARNDNTVKTNGATSTISDIRLRTDELNEATDYELIYANGQLVTEAELNLSEMDEKELESRLATLNAHIREAHHYCIWCGCEYFSRDDLEANCAGLTRQDHDDHDDTD